MNELEAKFREGLEELLFVNPVWGNLARSLGTPLFKTDVPTAWVEYDATGKQIRFCFNPDFLMTLDTETTAGVILHETHHVFLEHLKELTDSIYPDKDSLVKAQECIINDGVVDVFQLPLPEFVMRGPKLAGVDMSAMDTLTAYNIFAKPADEAQEDSGADKGGDSSKGDDTSKGSGSSTQSDDSADSEDEPNSDAGSDSQETSDPSDGSSSDDSADDDSDQDEANTSGADGEPTETDEAADNSMAGSCGGIKMPEGATPDDFAKAVADILGDAAKAMGVSFDELEEKIANTTPGGYSPTGAPVSEATQISAERMNWKLLLANINPKVLEAGKNKIKTRDNWTRYNRRMGSVYPKVIIPVNERVKPKDAKESGDKLPVLVIALDLSGSIDRSLVKMLQGMLNDIPEELIQAYPATWGSNLIPYNEENRFRVAGGGTVIANVVTYVDRVKKETGTDPYVLVITDGQYPSSHRKPGKDWFYMGVDRHSVSYIERMRHNDNGHQVYFVGDFKE